MSQDTKSPSEEDQVTGSNARLKGDKFIDWLLSVLWIIYPTAYFKRWVVQDRTGLCEERVMLLCMVLNLNKPCEN